MGHAYLDLLRKVVKGQQFFKFGVRVGETWRNRTLVLIEFQPSSSDSIQ